MRRSILFLFMLVFTFARAGTSLPIKDNSDSALTLSQANYNRIVVKNDKIIEAVFPPNSMAIKRDEQDGSVYVMLAATNPFTLFLTTETGHHFSFTINGEESLGKTIELIPQQWQAIKNNSPIKNQKIVLPKTQVPEVILQMLHSMERHEPSSNLTVKRQYGKAERWAKGLTLLPKESWIGKNLKGDVIELYNAGKEPIELSQEWFAKRDTLALKLSKSSIAPRERVMLYRVQGVSHG